jgi:ribokinase
MQDGGQQQYDVIAVGDVVTDAFIKLFDDQATTFTNEHGDWLAMPYGAKLPFERAEIIEGVGNAANAAVSLTRLGLKTAYIADVGGDPNGRDILAALQKNGVDTKFVRIHNDKKSNYHYVLWYKSDRTILIKHEDYDYHWPHLRPPEVPKWIYFSSISERALDMHDDIASWLEEVKTVKMAFQPGTFQIKAGAERLARLYKNTEVLVLNREEAEVVSKGDHKDIHGMMDKLHALGPKIVVITDGPDGAYASDGNQRLKMPLYPDPAPPVDRTGAGDSFASTFVSAIIKGNNIEGAMQWAPINSMNVVQHVGAQAGLLTEEQIEDYLKKSPEWYKPEPF